MRSGRSRLGVFVMVLLAALAGPLLFTDRTFGFDWPNHLWVLYQQTLNLEGLHRPSYFVQSGLGAYFPWFAFYGGTLYTLGGAIGVITGPITAYIVLWLLAFAMAYGGLVWLARQLGLLGWRGHAPAVVFVTSAYYITLIYGRGDLPEFVAISTIPLLVAAALNVGRADHLQLLPVAALVISATLFTGSHGITLVWGTTFLLLVGATVAAAVPTSALPSPRRLAQIAGLLALGAAINLWFLLPELAYSSNVQIGKAPDSLIQLDFTLPDRMFSLLRDSPAEAGTTQFQTQAPVLVLVWGLFVAVLVRRSASRPIRRLMIGLGAMSILFIGLMLVPQVIEALPRFWRYIQFPYRLHTYLALSAAGLVLVGLMALSQLPAQTQKRQAMHAFLTITLAASIALAGIQAWRSPSELNTRSAATVSPSRPPSTWYIAADYADRSAPVVQPTLTSARLVKSATHVSRLAIPARAGIDNYTTRVVVDRPGTIATNILAGRYLVHVDGARPVGRTKQGFMVLSINGRPGVIHQIKFSTPNSTLLRTGQLATIIALLTTAALLAALEIRTPRPRQRHGGPSHASRHIGRPRR